MEFFCNLLQILKKTIKSVFFQNILLGVSALIALKTYMTSVEQKRITNTMMFIDLFLNGAWIAEYDKKNWNSVVNKSLVLEHVRDLIDNASSECSSCQLENLQEIFHLEKYKHYVSAIKNVLLSLEFIANYTDADKLDEKIVCARLFKFLAFACLLREYVNVDYTSFSKLKKLFNKFCNAQHKFITYGEIGTFYIVSKH